MMLQGSPLPTDLEQPKSACPQLDGTSEESSEGCLAEQVSSAVMLGLKSECASVWFHCGAYERAESRYYVRLQEDENGTASSTSSGSATCQPGAQDACHRMVQSVWVNKPVFDLAEQRFAEGVPQRPFLMDAPLSLPLQARGPAAETPSDEGYLSLTPTPCASVPRPINGLPRLPAHLLGVWLQKPLYDRAEAAFYESLSMQTVSFGNLDTDCKEEAGQEGINNSINKESEPETLSQQPPDDEGEDVGAEEEEDDDDAKIVENGKDRTLSHFLHSDSERVWLDHGCYVEAETRYHERESAQFQTMQTSLITQGQSQMENMTGVDYLAQEKIWFDKPRYDEAEKQFYERMNGPTPTAPDTGANSILQDIARARENIQKSLAGLKTTLLPNRSPAHISPYPSLPQSAGCSSADQGELLTRMENMELENQSLHKVVEELRSALVLLENRVSLLERRPSPAVNAASPVVSPAAPQKAPAATTNDGADDEGDDDDDFDLFGSDEEEDEEAERIKEERLREYTEKKAKKPAIIAKSSILLDVKPWDDETDMAKLEECVRSVQADGLLWGSSKLIPVGYGIKKLQIQCVVEDDKVGTDLLEEEITKFEDYVQSVDVAAFNKI